MTSFKSRIDSFYAQERRSTLESRFALVWAIVVAVCYLLWNTTPPADRVSRFAIIFAVFGAIVLLVALWAAWRVRGVINRLRSLAPDDRDEVLGQHLTPEAREFYAKRLAAEGSVEFDGLVERFPFSPLDRRETLVLFWAAAAIGAIALAAALGMLGYLVSSALAARGGYQLIGPLTAGVLLIIMVPSGLLVEAGIVGWLGTKGLWRIFFLIITALGGIFFLRLAAVLFPRLGK